MKVTDRDKQLVRTPQDIISEQYADSLPICVRRCTKEEQCRSINYKAISSPNEKNCQLLAIKKSNASSVVTNAIGWIHYEHVSQVSYNVVLNITPYQSRSETVSTPSQHSTTKPTKHILIRFSASLKSSNDMSKHNNDA